MQIEPTSQVNTASLATGPLAGRSAPQRAVSESEAESFAAMAMPATNKSSNSKMSEEDTKFLVNSLVFNYVAVQGPEEREKLKAAIEGQS